MTNATQPTMPPTGYPTWDRHAAWWLSRFKPSTQQTWGLLLPRWNAWCVERDIDPMQAKRPEIEAWLQEIKAKGLSESSTAAHYDVVASIYRLAWQEELIERDPCVRIQRPPVHSELQRREVLSVLEFAAYLATARDLGPNEHGIAVLAGMMGLRASEMASLTVESLTVVRGYTVLTFMGKGDRPAKVPIPMPGLAAIHDLIDGRTSGPLLRTKSGAGMDRRAVHAYVVRTAKKAGINRTISPHALRRTVGTAALNQGIPLRDVQRMLRHMRSDSTLRSYDIAGDQIERHASHQIAGFLSSFS